MKAIDWRLRRLEESFAPQENEEVRSLVTLLLERRRRRLEASGEPFESGPSERLTDDQIRYLSVADVLRMGRRRVAMPQPPARLASEQCEPHDAARR
jgi:hypothetical protein